MAANSLARYWHTVRYLKPVQITDRLRRVLLPLRRPLTVPPDLAFRTLTPIFNRRAGQPVFRTGGAEIFGRRHDIDFATSWDVHDDDLWQYNLHYFDDLWVADRVDSGVELLGLIQTWIDTQTDLNGIGFAPYPTSLRIVNWCKYFWSLPEGRVSDGMIRSLALQAAVLERRLEYHLLANHLFANAKALVFAGTAFDGEFGARRLERGVRILEKQLDEQFLDDGAHFELSPMYHNLLVWDVLDLVALSQSAELPGLASMAGRLAEVARGGVAWSQSMAHDDDEVAFFNDAAIGIAPTATALAAYANRLGIPAANKPGGSERPVAVENLPASGYAVCRAAPYKATLDLAHVGVSYQPGHAHADTLSFEMSVFGQRCIVNTGVSTYSVGAARSYERSTSAHNTVVVNDSNSSDVWAGFRVGRRAEPFDRFIECDGNTCIVKCAHSGYADPPTNAVHHREWRFSETAVSIVDTVTGDVCTGRAYLHFHPECEVLPAGGGWQVMVDGQKFRVESSSSSATTEDYEWHEGFGRSSPAQRIVFPFEEELTVTLRFGDRH